MLLNYEEFTNFWKSKGICVQDIDYCCYLLGESLRENLR